MPRATSGVSSDFAICCALDYVVTVEDSSRLELSSGTRLGKWRPELSASRPEICAADALPQLPTSSMAAPASNGVLSDVSRRCDGSAGRPLTVRHAAGRREHLDAGHQHGPDQGHERVVLRAVRNPLRHADPHERERPRLGAPRTQPGALPEHQVVRLKVHRQCVRAPADLLF